MAKKKRLAFDEKTVAKEMAKALGVKIRELRVERSKTYEAFGVDKRGIYRIEIDRLNLGQVDMEFFVVEDDGVADALAVEVVKQDLQDSPSHFNQSFIEQHIDREKLKKELWQETYDRNFEDLHDTDVESFWWSAKGQGMYVPDIEDDDGKRDPTEEEIVECAEKMTEDELHDPVDFLERYFGEKAIDKAIEIVGIDVEAAANDAVRTDGPGHYLSSYDSNIHETPGGFVYWRGN